MTVYNDKSAGTTTYTDKAPTKGAIGVDIAPGATTETDIDPDTDNRGLLLLQTGGQFQLQEERLDAVPLRFVLASG